MCIRDRSSPASDSSSPAVVATTPVAAGAPIVEYAPPPAEYARAKAYSNSHYRHVFIGAFYGFLILLVILRWRVAPAFRNLAERASSSRFVQRIIFAPLILFTIAVLGIPSDIWDESLQRAYEMCIRDSAHSDPPISSAILAYTATSGAASTYPQSRCRAMSR